MDALDLAYAGIARQAQLISAGEISSRELLDLYLERIARHDPELNAFRVVFGERARLEAEQADARRGAGGERPLLGVPIAVKDDIDVAGELTAWGTDATSPDRGVLVPLLVCDQAPEHGDARSRGACLTERGGRAGSR